MPTRHESEANAQLMLKLHETIPCHNLKGKSFKNKNSINRNKAAEKHIQLNELVEILESEDRLNSIGFQSLQNL